MKEREGVDLIRPALRGALLFIAFLLVSRITFGAIHTVALKMGEESFFVGIPLWAVNSVALLGSLLIFSSFSTLFSFYDKYELERFLQRGVRSISIGHELCDTLVSRDFITEGTVSGIFVLLSALFGAFPEIGGIFFSEGAHRDGLFPALIMTPLLFLIHLLTKYEAKRYWLVLHRKHSLDSLSVVRFVITLLALIFLYPIIFPFAPLLGFMIFTFFNVIAKISEALTVLGFILATLAIVLIILSALYGSAMSKRRKFIKKLYEVAAKSDAEISVFSRPYRSFFSSECKESFTIKQNGRLFECTVISTVDRLVPLVFTSGTSAQFTRRLGTPKHHIDLCHPISFYPAGEGEQVLIINPAVKFTLVTDGTVMKELDGAARLWGFTLYSDKEFLGALSRGHIGKV